MVNPAAVASSPVEASVSTAPPLAVFSAMVAEFAVMSMARSVTVAVMVIVSVLAPSVTWMMTVQVLESSPAPQPGSS